MWEAQQGRKLSYAEPRYPDVMIMKSPRYAWLTDSRHHGVEVKAVLAVISDGGTVTDVAARFGASRQTVHAWLARYEAGGLENLGDRAHPPQGPRRLAFELGKGGIVPAPSESKRDW